MKKYEVLWIDDQADDQEAFSEYASRFEGINLTSFKTAKLGIEELHLNIEYYDAVILDAKGYDESEDEKTSFSGLNKAIKKINSLSHIKKIPYFIFSAYLDKKEHASIRDLLSDEQIFLKTLDNESLFKALKTAADQQEVTQLKHKYHNIFAICEEKYLGVKQFKRVLQVVRDIESPENISNQQDALSPMRKILEALFKKLTNLGLIPDEIQNGMGKINGASIFLAGKNDNYTYHQELINPVIAEKIRHLLGLTQDAAHDEGNKLGVDTYLSKTSNTYLYQSLCFSMLELLDYMKPFIDNNSDKALNQLKWEMVQSKSFSSNEWIPGIISRIAANNYGTFQPEDGGNTLTIIPENILKYALLENQNIQVTTKQSPCGTKTYIDEIKLVE
ncbi:hypothetical protein [Aequorivita sinensis]|uniref:hypothetical protein n=1 Tax=Aequorivita sinensis TaxID=1382458 RepID=UPI001124947C|nr:hypothetical protein [Aequorivita sinensis]